MSSTTTAGAGMGRGRLIVRLYRHVRHDWVSAAATIALLVLTTLSILAPVVTPYGPTDIVGFPTQPPSAEFLLGTDEIGRDILTRILYGIRVSLVVGLAAPSLALLIGVPWGLTSGYFGGWYDTISMRLSDGLLAFPAIIFALATVAALGPSIRNLSIAIGVVLVPRFSRITRGEVLRIREKDYVTAAVAAGLGDGHVMARTVLPNLVAVLSVQFALSVALAILSEAGLSFLGLGVQPPQPALGQMLAISQNYLVKAPLYSVATGGVIFLIVLSVSLIGDAIRDVADPRSVQRVDRSPADS